MSIFNTTPTIQAALVQVATAYTNGEFVTEQELSAAIQAANNSLAAAPSFQLCVINAGVVAIERRSKLNYAKIETEGLAASDTATSFINVGQAFQVGDLLICLAATTGHEVAITFDGIRNRNALLRTSSDGLLMVYTPTGWREIARWPDEQSSTKPLETDTAIIIGNSINFTASSIYARSISGETRADATVTITAAGGTAGSITLYADDGSGVTTFIGGFSYSSATTPSAVAAGLKANIDDIGLYGTQNLSGASFEIVAPVGSGAGGNSHSLSASIGGGITATIGGFSGGASGIEAAATLNTIVGGQEGSMLILRNAMTAASITLGTSGNIGYLSASMLQAGDAIPLIYSSEVFRWLPFERRAISMGFYHMAGNATATTISNTSDYYAIAGTTSASSINTGFTHSNNSLTLTGSSGAYIVDARASFSNGTNDLIMFDVFKNGVAQGFVMRASAGSGSSSHTASLLAALALATGDVVRIAVRNSLTATNVTVSDLQVLIKPAI